MSSATRVIVSIVIGLTTTHAYAGGLDVVDTGAEAVARSGAYVAKADSPTAVNYNPAGFGKLRGHHVAISSNIVHNTYDFSRNQGATVENASPWFAVPLHAMITTDFGYFDRWSFAGGFYGAAGVPDRDYTGDPTRNGPPGALAPQRFDFLQLNTSMFYPTLGVSYRPVEWLDVGVTLQAAILSLKTSSYTITGSGCDTREDPACNVRVDLDASDPFTPTGSLGVLARPWDHWEFGAMLRLPHRMVASGNAHLTLGSNVQRVANAVEKPLVETIDPAVTLTNDFPLVMRWGGRYVFYRGAAEVGDIEADFTFENWSNASTRSVQLHTMSFGKPLEPTTVDWHLNDTFSFRLGGAYRFLLSSDFDIILRGGSFGETASTDIAYTTLNVYGSKRVGLSAGLGFRWDRFQLDFAFSHTFFPTREVSESQLRAIQFDSVDGAGPVVGNGVYSASLTTFALQLTMSFGEGGTAEWRFARQPTVNSPQYAYRRGFRVHGAQLPEVEEEHEEPPVAVAYVKNDFAENDSSPAMEVTEEQSAKQLTFDADEVSLSPTPRQNHTRKQPRARRNHRRATRRH